MKIYKALVPAGLLFLSAICSAADGGHNIQIEITSYLGDKQVFQQGDDLKFLLSLDRDAYLYVVYQTADKQLVQIIPNKNKKDNFFKADIFIEVPTQSSTFQFTVSPPYGYEKVYAFALDKNISLEGKVLSNGLKRLSLSLNDIKEHIKKSAVKYYGWAYFSLNTQRSSVEK